MVDANGLEPLTPCTSILVRIFHAVFKGISRFFVA